MKPNFTLNYILNTICSYYGVKLENVKGNSRKIKFTEARQMFCYISKNNSENSLPKIGKSRPFDSYTLYK